MTITTSDAVLPERWNDDVQGLERILELLGRAERSLRNQLEAADVRGVNVAEPTSLIGQTTRALAIVCISEPVDEDAADGEAHARWCATGSLGAPLRALERPHRRVLIARDSVPSPEFVWVHGRPVDRETRESQVDQPLWSSLAECENTGTHGCVGHDLDGRQRCPTVAARIATSASDKEGRADEQQAPAGYEPLSSATHQAM